MSTFTGGKPLIRSLEHIRSTGVDTFQPRLVAECFDDVSQYSQNLAAQVAAQLKQIQALEARIKALGG